MSEVNTCVGSGEIKPGSSSSNQPCSQTSNDLSSNSGNQTVTQSQTNTKPIMRSSLITTKNFNKSGTAPVNTASLQVRHLSSTKIAKSSFSTSSSGTKMISPVVVSAGQSMNVTTTSSENVGVTIASVGSNIITPSTTMSNTVPQSSVTHQASIGALVSGTVPNAIGGATIKGIKTVVGGLPVSAGKVDANTRYILNSSKPSMTVNLTTTPGGSGGKVRFAPLMNVTVTDNQQQPQQHKVILQPANQNPPAPGAVVVTTKMQPTSVTISSVTSATSTSAGIGNSPLRFSYPPRRYCPQQALSQVTMPPQQSTGPRIFQTCVTSGTGNHSNLAPRMILASSGTSAQASIQSSASVQNLPQPQGSALTVSQQDLQRLQQSGAIAPVVTPSTQSGGTSMLTVRNVNTTSAVSPVQQTLTSPIQSSVGSNTATIEQALLMASSSTSLSSQQPFIPRKRTELTLSAHPGSHLSEGGAIGPSRIITLHPGASSTGSTQQITLQAANMAVAAHVTQQTTQPSTILTPQVQQLVHQQVPPGTVVIQPGPVRPEASNSPMRKRARKQQLQTVATPVTTPMTVEEEEEQKRKTMYMMTAAADRHTMSRMNSGGQVTSQSNSLSAVSSTHNSSTGSVPDPISTAPRLGSRAEIVGSLEVPNVPVGTPVSANISSSNRYRANSAHSSSSSSDRSTPRLVTSHNRKRHSPRSHSSVAAKLSRKAVLHTAGGRSVLRRNRINKMTPTTNIMDTASTSDTESDVEAVASVGVRDSNVCIADLLGNEDFHSPPTVTSSVRFGSSSLSQDLVMTPNQANKRTHNSNQSTNLRKRIFSTPNVRSSNVSNCGRQPPVTAVSFSQGTLKHAARRLSCEQEIDSLMEEDAVLDEDLEVDPIEEEVEAAEDSKVWGVSEDPGDLGTDENVSCDDRYLSQLSIVQHHLPRFGTSPDLSTVGANVAVSSTDYTDIPENEIITSSSESSESGTVVTGCRRMRITQNYHCNWKPRSGHFQSYQDVRERKNDKKNALVSLAVTMAEKKKLATIHWEVMCLLTSLKHMKSSEKEKLKRLENICENLREAKNAPETMKDLVKGNLQRCRLMVESITNQTDILEKFVSEQSKDVPSFLAPVQLYSVSNNLSSPSSSNAVYRHHSRHRLFGGVGGSNSSRTGSGAHRNLS